MRTEVFGEIGKVTPRRAWVVLAVWLVLAVALVLLVRQVGANTSDNLQLPGTDSQAAADLLATKFPPQQNGSSPLVFHARQGKVTGSSNKKAIEASHSALLQLPQVARDRPLQPGGQHSSRLDGHTAFIPVLLDVGGVGARGGRAGWEAGMEIAVGGPVGSELSEPKTESSELIGLLAAMVILDPPGDGRHGHGRLRRRPGRELRRSGPGISDRLSLVILVVIALGFLVLLAAYRSLLVSAQAALANVLSVSAAFGVLTACFQWGWGVSLVGLDTASGTVPIASYVPLIMFAVLFGLSMDYQVFLISQIAHHREQHGDDRQAIASGLASGRTRDRSGRADHDRGLRQLRPEQRPTVKQFGVGLSVGVPLWALFPRCLCVPQVAAGDPQSSRSRSDVFCVGRGQDPPRRLADQPLHSGQATGW
ncbi:MAG: MMPL family transporter, partial [Gaiellaceae bacterium]